MDNVIKKNMILLNQYGKYITKQQYKTFKGQILNGDIEGFRKGLFKVKQRLLSK